MEEFHKVRRLPPYVFEQVNRLKASARSRGADIIDLGMGNPDLPTPQAHRRQALRRRCATRAPTAIRPRAAFRACAAPRPAITQRRFGVKLNPDTQVVATLGSKEGFANMAQAITAPGDVILCPNPTYPIHAFGFIMSGGVIRSLPAEPDAGFIPALERGVAPFDPEAAGADPQLSVQSDRAGRDARFLQGGRRLREEARHHHPVRSRLFRDLFRRRAAAFGAAGAGRDRHRRRVHLDVEDLFDARLAHRLRGRQRAADRGADAREILSRLRRLHADPGGGGGRAQRRRRRHRRSARHLPQAPRRDGRTLRPRRLDDPGAGRLDVRLGADSRAVPRISARSNSPSC